MHGDDPDVLVVGAGPTGLCAALTLLRAGVRVEVVDGKRGPTRESRALVLQARTMEIYDQLGVVESALASAAVADAITPGYGRRAFDPVPLARFGQGLTPYPHLYVLEQSRNEELLAAAVADVGPFIRWGESLAELGVVEGPLPVRAVISTADGERRVIRARYCIGADGTASSVRAAAQVAFNGSTQPHRYYVADAVGVTGLPGGDANMRLAPDDFMLSFPMGDGGQHRLLGVVAEGGSASTDDQMAADVRDRLRDAFGVEFAKLNWFSTYRVHHRAAARFRDGPLFLAGDAAHVHSPVGAQGMNTGVQDAHNLACKLVDVLHHGAPDRSLDGYESERRPIALRLVRTTDRMFTAVTSPRPLPRFIRNRVVPLVAPLAPRIVQRLPEGSRLFGYLSQIRIRYPAPRAAGRRTADPVVGRRLPWNGRNHAALRSLAWQVHAYSRAHTAGAAAVGRQLGLEVHLFEDAGSNGLKQDRLYLIRPDGFVAASADPETALASFSPLTPVGLRGSD